MSRGEETEQGELGEKALTNLGLSQHTVRNGHKLQLVAMCVYVK